MNYRWIAVAIMALVLTPSVLASAQRPRTVDPEGGTGDPTEEDWLRQQKEVSGEDTEEAWIEEEDAKTATEVVARPATEGAAARTPSGTPGYEERRGLAPDSVRVTGRAQRRQERAETIPLKFVMHGFYRARYNWIGNVPLPRETQPGSTTFPTGQANFGYMRLRIDPEITYGPNPDLPIARLRFTVDGFDNVVFGDNARVNSTPIFAVDQSLTNIDGFDLRESLRLERAWIEFLVPVGQLRVGRMESQWGLGILTHAGNGLADWGEFIRGETFDRILFATRPITVARAITKGDARQTPLIFSFLYDRITQDPVVDSTISVAAGAATDYRFRPFDTFFPERFLSPFAYLTNLERRASQMAFVLAWFDPEFGRAEEDELFAGVWVLYRWQRSTETRLTIPDFAWRIQHTIGKRGIALTSAGEFVAFTGHSGAIAITGACPPAPCNRGQAAIYNLIGRIGATDPGQWDFRFESGFASGDSDIILNNTLKTRGFNENIKVGLLMYQVALRTIGFNQLTPLNAQALGPNGSVFNSKYFYPQYRFTIVPGLEAHATFLVAWAHKLDQIMYNAVEDQCGFKARCFYGWEVNAALRARIGQDIVWIDLESGLFQPGQAFTNAGLSDRLLWTVQVRAAMVF